MASLLTNISIKLRSKEMHRIILAAQKPLVLEGYCVGKPKERHVKSLPCLRLLGEFGWKLLTQVASTTFHKGWNHLHTGLGEPLRICLNNHGPSPDVNFISRCYIEVSDLLLFFCMCDSISQRPLKCLKADISNRQFVMSSTSNSLKEYFLGFLAEIVPSRWWSQP